MALCSSSSWIMRLALDSNPSTVERLEFDLTIAADGRITGVIINSLGRRMSQVSGQCKLVSDLTGLPSSPLLAFMSFIFRVRKGGTERGVHLSGIAFDPDPAHPGTKLPKFQGTLRTFGIDTQMPAPDPQSGTLQTITLAADPGDTGTGTGQQT